MSFDRRRRTSVPRLGSGLVPALAVALSALVLLWQALVLQTHVHAPALPGVGKTSVAEQRPVDDTAATCPLCQALTHSGAYVSPTGMAITTPSPAFGIGTAAPFATRIALHPSQGWRNRGPPVSAA